MKCLWFCFLSSTGWCDTETNQSCFQLQGESYLKKKKVLDLNFGSPLYMVVAELEQGFVGGARTSAAHS